MLRGAELISNVAWVGWQGSFLHRKELGACETNTGRQVHKLTHTQAFAKKEFYIELKKNLQIHSLWY